MGQAATKIYGRMVKPDLDALARLPEDVRRNVPGNGLRLIVAHALQNAGDQVVNASTVLAWLVASIGAPSWIIGLLVPVRESGSMLPQAALAPWVRSHRQRKRIWIMGAAGQAAAVAAMAFTAAVGTGTAAGVAILFEVACFALARALSSIASKDVQGRTIPPGQRGQINGIAAFASGVVAVTVGLGIRLIGGGDVDPAALAALLASAALAWVAALMVFARVKEPDGFPAENNDDGGWLARSWSLLREDKPFRRFVGVRGLLLVSALSPPFIVAMAEERGSGGLSGLGPFVIASGLAGILGGRLAGRLADRSSKNLMMWGCAASSLVVFALVAATAIPAAAASSWLYPAAFFLLALNHVGVRVARKTYVVDMATGDQRTEYVAVSNTAMGVLLLVTGGISSALAQLGTGAALLFLAALGSVGVVAARFLPEVSPGKHTG
ncbi:MFS transporter [Arthrobacter sp. VKM Ac-2550]|uniref:MFS transporter n=1 Tax=Crystallibacter permensis TaxID=1938888 RepID=UPI0022273EC9|nr:MFS transporter [Arthrobacter sp. VKM Ac-2550]MCW2131182.1 Major Facilitator Superfamily protein [Arthrobacter sp. VKM Ac-2550]